MSVAGASTTFVKPENPGVSISFVGEKITRPPPSFAEVVAMPIVHDWGPLGSDPDGGKLVTSFQAFEALYGTGDSPGRDAVLGAFNGIGLEGQGGAGGVIPYRMAGTGVAKATISLTNTAPAPSLKLDAIWPGARGNSLTAVVEDDPADVNRDMLRILFQGVEVERYRYLQADIAALAALINARPSRWVRATSLATGTVLTKASTALAGGNSGLTVTSAEWTAALAGLEFAEFGIIAPFNLVDSGVTTVIFEWQKMMAREMRPVQVVFGGAAGEIIDDAITAAAAIRDTDGHVIRLAVGTYYDDLLDKEVSTAQLAPRLAGVLAARGDSRALTYAQMAGLHAVGDTGPTTSELRVAADNGLTVLRRVSNPDAELVVARGVTTFINPSLAGRPLEVFTEPRFIRIMDSFIRTMKAWAEDNVIGDLTVTDDTRAAVRGQAQAMIADLVTRGLVLPGTSSDDRPFIRVEDPHDPELEDAIPFTFGWKFARTANFVIGQGRVL